MLLTSKGESLLAKNLKPLTSLFRSPPARRRNKMSYSASVPQAIEKLEDRIVLSAASARAAANLEVPDIDAGETLVTITDIVVDSIEVVEEGGVTSLVANTIVTGTILGQDFTETVEIPIDLGASPLRNDGRMSHSEFVLGTGQPGSVGIASQSR